MTSYSSKPEKKESLLSKALGSLWRHAQSALGGAVIVAGADVNTQLIGGALTLAAWGLSLLEKKYRPKK